jgi:hypothetical protein
VAEGAPLLREYVGKTCIEGSNPSGSAKNVLKNLHKLKVMQVFLWVLATAH